MRDPVPRVDPDEAAIEDTCRYLESSVQSETWKADADGFACDCRAAIEGVQAATFPDWADDWAKTFAIFALLEQTKKRRSKAKPTRKSRNMAIRMAAIRLVLEGYKPTRNDVTADRESASSIIHEALRRLGENLSEKSINTIIAKDCRPVVEDSAYAELLRRVLK